jgi:hypothetical protein
MVSSWLITAKVGSAIKAKLAENAGMAASAAVRPRGEITLKKQ